MILNPPIDVIAIFFCNQFSESSYSPCSLETEVGIQLANRLNSRRVKGQWSGTNN